MHEKYRIIDTLKLQDYRCMKNTGLFTGIGVKIIGLLRGNVHVQVLKLQNY